MRTIFPWTSSPLHQEHKVSDAEPGEVGYSIMQEGLPSRKGMLALGMAV